jgi:hypothetical protein
MDHSIQTKNEWGKLLSESLGPVCFMSSDSSQKKGCFNPKNFSISLFELILQCNGLDYLECGNIWFVPDSVTKLIDQSSNSACRSVNRRTPINRKINVSLTPRSSRTRLFVSTNTCGIPSSTRRLPYPKTEPTY